MTPDELKNRTKKYAIAAIRLCDSLPNSRAANIVANQLIRSATSVGANYRAACRARSDPDFVSKVGVTLEEADESVYWIEIIFESGMKKQEQVADFHKEGTELTAIFTASWTTARKRVNKNLKSKI